MAARISEDMLQMGPVREVRVDYTELCNLRCVYCAVSSQSYHGIEMSLDNVSKSLDIINNLSKYHSDLEIDVNGNGETTSRKDWVYLVQPILLLGINVRIQSNMAKVYSQIELETLACMKAITVSIDTSDRRLLRDVRRHVDVRHIVANISFIRAAAVKLLRKPPLFIFACGLYDKNSLYVEDLARLAISLDVKIVDFWNLLDHGHEDNGVGSADRVIPLDELPNIELLPRIEAILRAVRLLRFSGIIVSIHADFINALASRVGIHV
jgi:MoaA/NifB/PqqE/SkfB family radical SAM enzyme